MGSLESMLSGVSSIKDSGSERTLRVINGMLSISPYFLLNHANVSRRNSLCGTSSQCTDNLLLLVIFNHEVKTNKIPSCHTFGLSPPEASLSFSDCELSPMSSAVSPRPTL